MKRIRKYAGALVVLTAVIGMMGCNPDVGSGNSGNISDGFIKISAGTFQMDSLRFLQVHFRWDVTEALNLLNRFIL